MVNTISYPDAPDLAADDYIVIGLATCFIKEEGEVHQVDVIEPIPSASLEAIFINSKIIDFSSKLLSET